MGQRMLIIQFKMTGAGDELAWLQSLEELLIQAFRQNRVAEVDGNDFGSGTMNLYVRPKDSWSSVIEIVKAHLKHRQVLDRALIVKRLPSERHVVVWPPDYRGEFDYV